MLSEEMVIASVDDHIVEPPGRFERHLPKDVVRPRLVENERGDQRGGSGTISSRSTAS